MTELLLPAGDKEKAYIAFKYGADAIYCGSPMFSLRTRMNTFTENDMEEVIDFAHKNGKKVYITLNGFPHQNMVGVLTEHIKKLSAMNPDGFIIADSGVLHLANTYAPKVPKHLSVQSSTVNAPGIEFWKKNGVSRIILAREIPLDEVKKIHEAVPDIELEYFVHGAVCMAYSGRCLLSNFMAARDANRGACAHSCRWSYRVYDENGYTIDPTSPTGNEEMKDIHSFEKKQYWEEELRQGEFIPVEEDFHGTHIMSSRDMCMIELLQEVVDAGVVSLKVEGRNKTIYYLASVGRAYRQALDDLQAGKSFDETLWDEIHATANRGFFAGFARGKPQSEGQQYEANASYSTFDFVGQVLSYENGRLQIEVKNRIDTGDILETVLPNRTDDIQFTATNLEKNGEKVEALHGGNGDGFLDAPAIPVGTLLRKKNGALPTENGARLS